MLTGAVLLFSIQFVFSKCYQREKGSSFFYSMLFSVITGAVSIPYFLILNGSRLEMTPFSLFLAVLYSIDALACTVFGVKTLERANLSVYSLFMMLGGMLLPFLYGFTLGEEMTLIKGVAMLLVLLSMAFTLKKEDGKKTDLFLVLCYGVIFVTNGLTGVMTFMHQRATVAVVSASGFLLLSNIVKTVLALAVVAGIFIAAKVRGKDAMLVHGAAEGKRKPSPIKSWVIAVGCAVGFAFVNGTGSLLSTLTASYIEAGIQSTIGTGGCLLMSALFGLLFGERITKKTVFTLACALTGTVLIML